MVVFFVTPIESQNITSVYIDYYNLGTTCSIANVHVTVWIDIIVKECLSMQSISHWEIISENFCASVPKIQQLNSFHLLALLIVHFWSRGGFYLAEKVDILLSENNDTQVISFVLIGCKVSRPEGCFEVPGAS